MTTVAERTNVLPLYPPGAQRALGGLYLEHDLRAQADERGLIYANFIASLDGRVAMPDRQGVWGVPSAMANPRDWWLFQELAVQADALLISARYLRARARGEGQDLFAAFHESAYRTLRKWRATRGLPPSPRVVVLARELDFLPPDDFDPARLLVLSGAAAVDSPGARRLRLAGVELRSLGTGMGIDAKRLRSVLVEAGCRLVYAVGGPRLLHLLVAGGALDRLYLSQAPQLLGGESMSTLLEGPVLEPAPALRLRSLYWDQSHAGPGAGQLFASYSLGGASA